MKLISKISKKIIIINIKINILNAKIKKKQTSHIILCNRIKKQLKKNNNFKNSKI